MKEMVAQTKVVAIDSDGSKQTVHIKIGKPYLELTHDSGQEQWRCPVSMKPMYSRLVEAAGGDSFQSLCMASSLVIKLLESFKENGGKLHFENHENCEFPIEAYHLKR